MHKIFYLLLLCAFLNQSSAQVKPDFFPEDLIDDETQLECYYCQPGVKDASRSKGIVLVYGYRGNGNFHENHTADQVAFGQYDKWDNLEFKMKIPVYITTRWKVLLGYKYFYENFDFSSVEPKYASLLTSLNNRKLKSNNFGLIVNHSIDQKKYVAVRFRLSYNGNYDGWMGFDGGDAIYKVLGIYGIKPNEDTEWGIGMNISKSFRRFTILPFLLYNKNFNQKWGLEAVLPGMAYIRYNWSDNNILLAGVEYGSRSFRMDAADLSDPDAPALDYAYNHAHIKAGIRFERKIAPWIWTSLHAGYQINFNTDFESKNDWTTGASLDPTSSMFFKVGVFLSPESKEE